MILWPKVCCLVAAVGLLSVALPWCLLTASMPLAGLFALDTAIAKPGGVLIVTAHPDDEVIFFSPTISALRGAGKEVSLLCLTNGDAHGLGQLRARELQTAAAALQIDAKHLTLIDNDKIQDGHHTVWDAAEVVRIISQEVVTFDKFGVYRHKNHIACYDGVRLYLQQCKLKGPVSHRPCPKAWKLLTVSTARKYASVFDIIPSAVEGRLGRATTYINRSVIRTLRAMAAHNTQWRWWIHVLTTRYTFVNTLQPIQPMKGSPSAEHMGPLFGQTRDSMPTTPSVMSLWHKARMSRALRMGFNPVDLGVTPLPPGALQSLGSAPVAKEAQVDSAAPRRVRPPVSLATNATASRQSSRSLPQRGEHVHARGHEKASGGVDHRRPDAELAAPEAAGALTPAGSRVALHASVQGKAHMAQLIRAAMQGTT